MVQAVSHRSFTAETRVRSRVTSWRICGGRIGIGRGSSPSTSGVSCQYHFTRAPHSFIHLTPTPWLVNK